MKHLDVTLDSPEYNLALDEALLDLAEQGVHDGEVLRFWEPHSPAVILGRSSRVAQEVNEAECRRRGIPILRRSSGGATILAGPGCLMYAVVLDMETRPHLRAIHLAHAEVLDRHRAALEPLVGGVSRNGTSDLTWDNRKFSGNSLRCKRTHLLYHGTLLYDLHLEPMQYLLRTPPRQPDYRADRDHQAFLVNLPLDRESILQALVRGWNAHEATYDWPQEMAEQLVVERYSTSDWTYGF